MALDKTPRNASFNGKDPPRQFEVVHGMVMVLYGSALQKLGIRSMVATVTPVRVHLEPRGHTEHTLWLTLLAVLMLAPGVGRSMRSNMPLTQIHEPTSEAPNSVVWNLVGQAVHGCGPLAGLYEP
eukprot:3396441-Prymnesium_polylepis.1